MALPSPVSVSLKAEPVRFSKLVRVSLPAPPVSWAGALIREADRHGVGGIEIAGGVGAVAAIQDIVAIAAVQRVIAGEAEDRVVVIVAGERVVVGRAGQVLEIGEGIGAGADGVLGDVQGKADGDAGWRRRHS